MEDKLNQGILTRDSLIVERVIYEETRGWGEGDGKREHGRKEDELTI